MKEPKKKQLIRLIIPSAGAEVETINVTTDAHYKHVLGYRLYLNQATAERKSTCALKIDGFEIEPEKYPVEGMICGTEVSPNERYKKMPFPVSGEGVIVNFSYKDGGALSPSLYPYTVVLALDLSNEEQHTAKP